MLRITCHRQPVANAPLVSCVCFFDIGHQQERALACVHSGSSFRLGAGASKVLGIQQCSCKRRDTFNMVRRQGFQPFCTLQSVDCTVTRPGANIDLRNIGMGLVLPGGFENSRSPPQIIFSKRALAAVNEAGMRVSSRRSAICASSRAPLGSASSLAEARAVRSTAFFRSAVFLSTAPARRLCSSKRIASSKRPCLAKCSIVASAAQDRCGAFSAAFSAYWRAASSAPSRFASR